MGTTPVISTNPLAVSVRASCRIERSPAPPRGSGRRLAGLFVLLLVAASALPAAARFEAPVTFTVRNLNRSSLPCASDGATYEVRGHLVTPGVPGPDEDAVTLYLHGFSFGEWLWRFRAVPGFDHVGALADDGHASVVIDRIGYDTSGRPHGFLSCWGSQADVVHQIAAALRSGDYTLASGDAVRFASVAVAGHSAGAAIAQIATYSGAPIDALVLVSYADQGASNEAIAAGLEAATVCAGGGEPSEEGGPSGYAYYGRTPDDFASLQFHDAPAALVAEATRLRNRDPCGDLASLLPEQLVVSPARLRSITIPVLLLCGADDVLYESGACDDQRRHFAGSPDVTFRELDGSGHAIPLDAAAGELRRVVSEWLRHRGF